MDISEKNWEQIRKYWGGESRVTPSILPYCVFATAKDISRFGVFINMVVIFFLSLSKQYNVDQ